MAESKMFKVFYMTVLIILLGVIIFLVYQIRDEKDETESYVDMWLEAEEKAEILSSFITTFSDEDAEIKFTVLSEVKDPETGGYIDAVRWEMKPSGYHMFVTKDNLYLSKTRDDIPVKVF